MNGPNMVKKNRTHNVCISESSCYHIEKKQQGRNQVDAKG